MELKKLTYTHRNVAMFIILSMFYLHSVYLLSVGETILSVNSIKEFFYQHFIILLFGLATLYSVLKFKKFSEYLFLVFISLIVIKIFFMLFSSLNKLVLILNFSYILFAFFYYMNWDFELKKASFNPSFSKLDLEKETRFKLVGNLLDPNNHENKRSCLLTNLDKESCFVMFVDGPVEVKSLEYILNVELENIHFKGPVKLVSTYDKGCGLSFAPEAGDRFGLRELYKVCLERGMFN